MFYIFIYSRQIINFTYISQKILGNSYHTLKDVMFLAQGHLKKDNDVVFCIQMDSNGKFSNMWPKVGITVNNALPMIAKCALDMHRSISFDIDRRLWPKTVLNGLNISSMHTTKPQKKYCVRNPKGILVDSLSYENTNALHYALYDSGKFVIECS